MLPYPCFHPFCVWWWGMDGLLLANSVSSQPSVLPYPCPISFWGNEVDWWFVPVNPVYIFFPPTFLEGATGGWVATSQVSMLSYSVCQDISFCLATVVHVWFLCIVASLNNWFLCICMKLSSQAGYATELCTWRSCSTVEQLNDSLHFTSISKETNSFKASGVTCMLLADCSHRHTQLSSAAPD